MRFDLVDLRLFVNVVEAGTITQGAERSHITLASASERVRGMEAVLGAPLLNRHKRGVQPTEAGLVLLEHARRMLLQMEQLSSDMQAFGQGLGMRVELLANTSAMSEHLVQPLGTFLQANPQLRLSLREACSEAIVQALLAGEADLGVVSDAMPTGALHTQPWRADPLVILGSYQWLETLPEHPRLSQLAGQPLLGLLPQHALQKMLNAQALLAGCSLHFRAQAPHLQALCDWAAMGLGGALVPHAAALRCLQRWPQADLQWRVLREPWAQRQLLLACRDPQQLSTHAQALMQHLLGSVPSQLSKTTEAIG